MVANFHLNFSNTRVAILVAAEHNGNKQRDEAGEILDSE